MNTPGKTAGTGREPLLSVIVPVYNVEPYLRRCLESICNQSYRNLEIICVDDGSTDGSLAILREYEAKDSRIRVASQPNSGQAAARNVALDMATGDWVTGVDSDDYMLPHAYATTMPHATDGVDMVVFGVKVETAPGSGLERHVRGMDEWANFSYKGLRSLDAEHLSNLGWYFVNKLYRRSLIEECHLRFDASNTGCEDMCFFMRYCACATQAFFCTDRLYAYALRQGSTMFVGTQAQRRLHSFLNAIANLHEAYGAQGKLESHAALFAYLLGELEENINRYSFLAGEPLLWRRRLLELIRRLGLHQHAATAPVAHRLEEQCHTLSWAVGMLKAAADGAHATAAGDAATLHVAIPVDEEHAGQALLLAQGLQATVNAGQEVCVHFIAENLSPYTQTCLKTLAGENLCVRLHALEAEILHQLPPLEQDFPRATWLKMSLPWVLPELERVLVLSPGLLLTGALPSPHSVDMGEMPVAVLSELPLEGREDSARRLWLERYESGSVFFMNLAGMRGRGKTEAWVAAGLFRTAGTQQVADDLFNIAFRGRMAELPAEWTTCVRQVSADELARMALKQGENMPALPLDARRMRAWTLHLPRGRRVEDLALMQGELRWKYCLYSLLSRLPLGRKRRHYAEKRRLYRELMKRLRRWRREVRGEWRL